MISAGMEAAQSYVASRFAAEALWLEWANALFSFALFALLFAMIYRILPDARIPWKDVWLGALSTSLLFVIGKWAIGLYLGRSAASSDYGAAGSVIVLLLWVYYASLIILLGAEFTRSYSRHLRAAPERPPEAGAEHQSAEKKLERKSEPRVRS